MAAAAPLAAAAIPAFEGLGMIGAAAAPALGAAAPAAAGLGAGALGAALPTAIPETMSAANAAGLSGMMVPLSAAPNSAFALTPLQQLAMGLNTAKAAMGPYGEALGKAGKAWQAGQMLGGQGQQPMPRRAPAMPQMPTPRPMAGAMGGPNPVQIALAKRFAARNRNRRGMA